MEARGLSDRYGTGVSTEGHGLLAVVGLNQTGGMLSDSRARFVLFNVHVPTNRSLRINEFVTGVFDTCRN